MSKRILLTGASGFIGAPLQKQLLTSGFEVKPFEGQLEDSHNVKTQVLDFKPDIIIHLAGLSNVGYCEANSSQAFQVNTLGTIELARALALVEYGSGLRPTFILASSAQVYASLAGDLGTQKITESWPIKPKNTYGESKRLAEVSLAEICRYTGIKCVIARLFNHTHSSQSPEMFLPSMVKQISEISGDSGRVVAGDLSLKRDIGLVQDLLRAFVSLCQNVDKLESHEVFNICSGSARELRSLVTLIADHFKKNVEVVFDVKRTRKDDPPFICGDSTYFQSKTGWKPSVLSDADFVSKFFATLS